MIIAIDGPAGAGKTTISKRVCHRLGFVRLDTGAIYRAVAYTANAAGLTPNSDGLEAFVKTLDLSFTSAGVGLAGEPLEDKIRLPNISKLASEFSAQPEVRRGLLELQRKLGRSQNSVVDGRDIGTVVFPDAELKIFLTAGIEERARRRWLELKARGQEADLIQIRDEIEARDKADTEREIAPLVQAEDAILLDSTTMDIEAVVELIVAKAMGLGRTA